MKYYLSICAIFRDEAPYLEEWLRFHSSIGVEHFFLYDNNSTDEFAPVLEPWIASGVVSLLPWPHKIGQLSAYAHCLQQNRSDTRWLAFIDIDEFLFSPGKEDVAAVLQEYEAFPAVGANWVVFGAAGHLHRPQGLVTRSYLRRASFDLRVGFERLRRPGGHPMNLGDYPRFCRHIKSIVDPREVVQVITPHSARYRKDRLAVDENKAPIRRGHLQSMSDSISVDRLRINHYWSKSIAELEAKVTRGAATAGGYYTKEFALRLERYLNAVTDRTILPVVDRVFPLGGSISAESPARTLADALPP